MKCKLCPTEHDNMFPTAVGPLCEQCLDKGGLMSEVVDELQNVIDMQAKEIKRLNNNARKSWILVRWADRLFRNNSFRLDIVGNLGKARGLLSTCTGGQQ